MGSLSVDVNGVRIGYLQEFEEYRQQFTFDSEYLNSLISKRPLLGQIFEDRIPNGILVDGPICWFSHLLPQGMMRHWRCQLLEVDDTDNFALLDALGEDLPGAVVIRETELTSRRKPEALQQAKIELQDLLKFSLAGAQWKLSARSSGRGLTTAAKGSEAFYIAKFHSPEYPELPRREFATMTWAKQAGISVPEFELKNTNDFDDLPEELPVGDGKVFVIKRFDRQKEKRIHIEDFGQILDRPPGNHQYQGTYGELADVLKWLSPECIPELIKLVVFNVLAGNGDAHLKNFSVIYDLKFGRSARLSPAYDLVSTVLYYGPRKEKLALELGGTKSFYEVNDVSLKHFIETGNSLGFDGDAIVQESVAMALDAFNQPVVKHNFSNEEIKTIQAHISSVPIAQ